MIKNQYKLRLWINSIIIIVSLIILTDFILPGKVVSDEIVMVKKEIQQHKTSSKYHDSYKIITNTHQFSVSEDFVSLVSVKDNIVYSVSSIFNEVNWYRLLTTEKKDVYSLRIITGLIVPLFTIVLIVIANRFNYQIGTLVFLAHIFLIADLIYLLL